MLVPFLFHCWLFVYHFFEHPFSIVFSSIVYHFWDVPNLKKYVLTVGNYSFHNITMSRKKNVNLFLLHFNIIVGSFGHPFSMFFDIVFCIYFLSYFDHFQSQNGSQNRRWLAFGSLFHDLVRRSIRLSISVALWLRFGSMLLPLGSFLLTVGSLLLPFGFILALFSVIFFLNFESIFFHSNRFR